MAASACTPIPPPQASNPALYPLHQLSRCIDYFPLHYNFIILLALLNHPLEMPIPRHRLYPYTPSIHTQRVQTPPSQPLLVIPSFSELVAGGDEAVDEGGGVGGGGDDLGFGGAGDEGVDEGKGPGGGVEGVAWWAADGDLDGEKAEGWSSLVL
ncbi:hypothetical protein PMIN02_008023 [Paraphaeosphaeria minitans]